MISYHRFGSESIAFRVGGLRHDQSMKRPLSYRETQGTRSSGAAGVAMNENFPLAITMGDASGIGPEIVAKALKNGTERASSSAAWS